jgi:outer membrane protein assembly factor BamB
MVIIMRFALFMFLTVLCSCSSNKEILSGKRERLSIGLPIDHVEKKEKIVFPPALKNFGWERSGGNAVNNMPSLQLPTELQKKWQTLAGCGKQYDMVCNQKAIFLMDCFGVVSAYSVEDGKTLWKVNTSPKGQSENTLKGGLLLVDNVLFITTSFGEVLSLNIFNGEIIWRKNVDSPLRAGANLYKNFIYFTTISNETYALDKDTGSVLWTHQGLSELSSFLGLNTPAILDDVLVTAYTSGEYFGLDSKTGVPLWHDTITPALRPDSISSISHIRANPIINDGHFYITSHAGKTICGDLKNGERIWQNDVGGSQNMNIVGDLLVTIDYNDVLYGVSKKSGHIMWQIDLRSLIVGDKNLQFFGPVLVNNHALITTSSGKFVFIDLSTQKIAHTVETGYKFNAAPVISNRMLYIMNEIGYLLCYS